MAKPKEPQESAPALRVSDDRLFALEARKSRARRILDGIQVKPIEMLEPGEKTTVIVMVEDPLVQRSLTRAQKFLLAERKIHPQKRSLRPWTPEQRRKADHERVKGLDNAVFEVDKFALWVERLKREENGPQPPESTAPDRGNKLESLNELLRTRGLLFYRAVEQFTINSALVEEGMALLNDPAKFNAYQDLGSALLEEDAVLKGYRDLVDDLEAARTEKARAKKQAKGEKEKRYLHKLLGGTTTKEVMENAKTPFPGETREKGKTLIQIFENAIKVIEIENKGKKPKDRIRRKAKTLYTLFEPPQ